jgi:hypothetical protein
MCQNVKPEILVEIINRLLLELQPEVVLTINSSVCFGR